MKKASREVAFVTEKRMRHFIQEGGREVERVAPKIKKKHHRKKYKTRFRLLGNFGEEEYLQMKKNANNFLKQKK